MSVTLIEKLRDQCLKRGAAGIKGIGCLWKQLDDDNSKTLSFNEFREGIVNHNISFTSDEITQLFKSFDKDNGGSISFDEFLFYLRPPLNNMRLSLINKAFQKLDRTRDGQITVQDLVSVYNCQKHPKYQNGEWTQEQCLQEFLNSFEVNQHKDGIVTYDEFVNYYAGVSSSIDLDIYFDIMMRQTWKL